MTRTVLSEAGQDGTPGMTAVASVIRNRVASGQYGSDPSDVVLAPNQFSSWSLPGNSPDSPSRWKPQSPQYQQASQIVNSVWSGKTPDPTGGADHYLNPAIVQAQRGSLPGWAQGNPTAQIGGHSFYASPQAAPSMIAMPSSSDIAATKASLGIPQWQAVPSSGPGPTVMMPTGGSPTGSPSPTVPPPVPATGYSANVTPDDINATAKMLGLNAIAKTGAPQTSQNLPQPANTGIVGAAPGKIPQVSDGPVVPTPQEAQLAESRGLPMQAVGAIPIAGPLINAATAAGQAFQQPGGSFYDRFTAQLARQRNADQYFAQQYPVASTVAQFAGSGAGYGGLGVTGFGRAALGMAEGLPWGTRAYLGAVGGGALGGVDASLRGQNPLTGAEIGAAGGVLGPALSEGARMGTGALANYAYPRPGPLSNVPRSGINLLTGALEGETFGTLAAAKTNMGPAGFFGDLTPATTDLTGAIADTAGPGKAIVRGAYQARAADQANRIDASLTKAMGPNFNILNYKNFITENRKAAADPLYQQFRSMQVHPTKEIQALVPRLDAAGAFDQAEKLAAINGDSVNRNFFVGGPQKQFPTTQSWDYVKRALDSKIDTAYAGGDKTTAASLIKLKNDMLTEVGKTPAGQVWNQARSEFADRSALIDQINAGRDTFIGGRSGTTPDEMAEELKGLSGPELAARIYGARTAAADAMGDTFNGDTTLRNKLLAPNNQKKLALLLQNPAKSDALVSELQSERYLSGQHQNVVGGSQTTPKAQRLGLFAPPELPQWGLDVTKPGTYMPPALRPHNVLQSIINQQYAKSAPALAPLMTTPQGPRMDALLSSILGEGARMSKVNRLATKGGNVLSGIIAGPTQETYRLNVGH